MNNEPATITTPNPQQAEELASLKSDKAARQADMRSMMDWQDRWKNLSLAFGIGVVACTIFTVFFQVLESTNSYKQRPVAARLSAIEARERQINDDISKAEIELAKRDASIANKRAGDLEKEAAAQRERASGLEQQTALLKEQNLTTEQTLETERQTRLELEKSLAPRVLPYREYTDGTTNVDDLKSLGQVSVILEYLPDAEAARTASNLAFLFSKAGWKIVSLSPTANHVMDGVAIEGFGNFDHSRPEETEELIKEEWKSNEVRDRVRAWLALNNWDAWSPYSGDPLSIKPGHIVVQVGFKPNAYFDGPRLKRMKNEIDAIYGKLGLFRKAPNANPHKPIKLEQLSIPGENFSLPGDNQ